MKYVTATLTALFKNSPNRLTDTHYYIENKQGPAVQHRELYSASCKMEKNLKNDLYITESLH